MPAAKMTSNTNWHVLPAALLVRKKNCAQTHMPVPKINLGFT